MKFKDKVVLVTGASRGIGTSIALHFGKEGATVIVNYLNSEEKALKVSENVIKLGGKSKIFKCDVSIENEVINMVDYIVNNYGKIDILINNAGTIISTPILSRTVEQWKKVIDTNLLGTFLCSKYVGKKMLIQKKGHIINIGSVSGTKSFSPDLIDYDISKSGITALTKDFAIGFSPYIRVNMVSPGNIDTDKLNELSKGDLESQFGEVFLNRLGKISELVKVILFLSSDESSYINGTNVFVDGGM